MSFINVKIPHVFVLITGIILLCCILSYFIPSGNYARESKTIGGVSRTVVIPGTYEKIEKYATLRGILLGDKSEGKASPVSVLQFLTAIPRGMEEAASIIFFIFIIGGVFSILQHTGTISALIHYLLLHFKNSGFLLPILLMLIFSIGSTTIGMGEEYIALIPIIIVVSRHLGYDRIFGVAIVLLAGGTGFAAATTNPFTVQIAQSIAEIPLVSGLLFRMIFYMCCMIIVIVNILKYGHRIRKNSTEEGTDDEILSDNQPSDQYKITKTHISIIGICIIIFGFILFAVQTMGWWINEMSGGFILMGLISALISKLTLAETVRAFIQGLEEIVVAALVVGFARGIQVVLIDGQIMDSIINSAASLLQKLPKIVAVQGMLLFQSILNFFIPSGSGQATVTVPLMAPLSDLIGVTRQTSVFAFTCGDGFSNAIIPTNGVTMAMLSLAKVPFEKWVRFAFPIFLQLMALSAIFLAIAVVINYN